MTAPLTTRPQPLSSIGRQLYRVLPAVYRQRDNPSGAELGDLGKYLDACGDLLDLVRATLDQRLADSFPDNPPKREAACQEWLVPYFAELVDVRLVSPDLRGRRDEVAQAVAWRQRKGTVACIEEIAQSVGGVEVEVQEGWKRVAMTPRVNEPLLPPQSFGVTSTRPVAAGGREPKFDPRRPADAARHPGLPAATVDFAYKSGAVQTGPANAAGKVTRFGTQSCRWRQVNPHGVPCAPGSYQDVSRRTVDLRTPDWCRGQAHPRRMLLFAPPPLGFFGDPGVREIPGNVTLAEGSLEGAVVRGTVTVTGTGVLIDGCAIARLVVNTPGADPAGSRVTVRNSLIGELGVAVPNASGLVEMEYCTVLRDAACTRLNASDCIFAGSLRVTYSGDSCVRFSRVPPDTPGGTTNTGDAPVFQDLLFCDETEERERQTRRVARFGEPGCGVLHPAAPDSVRLGAEDGGEMGAYHAQRYALRMKAVLDKLNDFVPVGMEAVLIPDPYLSHAPPDGSEADQ